MRKSMVHSTQRMQAHTGDKQREGQMNEIRHCAYKGEHTASDGPQLSCSVAVFLPQFARIASNREHACLECTFGHQENFSKISQSVMMVYYHLFFPFMLTHCANIIQDLCFELKLIVFSPHLIFRFGSAHPAMYFQRNVAGADQRQTIKLQNLGVFRDPPRDVIGIVQAAGSGRSQDFTCHNCFKNPVVIIAHNYEQLQI